MAFLRIIRYHHEALRSLYVSRGGGKMGQDDEGDTTSPIILIIEDYEPIGLVLREKLEMFIGNDYLVIIAKDMEETLDLFEQYRGRIAIITVDGEIPTGDTKTNTRLWVKLITEEGFPRNKIVAASTCLQEELVVAGCGHRCDQKAFLPEMIVGILTK